jgi:hypothetical protein
VPHLEGDPGEDAISRGSRSPSGFVSSTKWAIDSIVPLVEELMHEIDQRQSGYEMVVDSIVLQILVHLFRKVLRPSLERSTKEPVRQLPSWQMVRTLEYMNARGKSKFSVAELCAENRDQRLTLHPVIQEFGEQYEPARLLQSPHRRQSAEDFGGQRSFYQRGRVRTGISKRKSLL